RQPRGAAIHQLAATELDDPRLDLRPRLLALAHAASVAQPRSPLLLFGGGCGSVSYRESTALGFPQRGHPMAPPYAGPNRAARAANTVIRWLAELGISIAGTRALRVRGRKSGKQRAVVVNLLTVDGADYLVSPRGNTQWARNVRAAGVVEVGPRWRRERALVSELDDAAKPDFLRRYLARGNWQGKDYVSGLPPDSSDEQLLAAARTIPVFALTPSR